MDRVEIRAREQLAEIVVELRFVLLRILNPLAGRLAPLLLITGRAVGMPSGIVAGQAWESEPNIDLQSYQQAKTGALFAAATMAGAASAGAAADPWRELGERLGEAFQVADDIRARIAGLHGGQPMALADYLGAIAGFPAWTHLGDEPIAAFIARRSV